MARYGLDLERKNKFDSKSKRTLIIVFVCLAVVNVFNNEAIDKKLEDSLMGDKFSSVVANFTISLISFHIVNLLNFNT